MMLVPVLAAMSTTLAAFAPILMIGGTIGQMMGVLPLVVVAVLIASLLECFLVLPGHLANSLAGRRMPGWSWWRQFLVALVACRVSDRLDGSACCRSGAGCR
jgi:multidrug efflux pump subunit AcrB